MKINTNMDQENAPNLPEALPAEANYVYQCAEPMLRVNFNGKFVFANKAAMGLAKEWKNDARETRADVMARWIESCRKNNGKVRRSIQIGNRAYLTSAVLYESEKYIDFLLFEQTESVVTRRKLSETATRLASLIANLQSGILVEDENRCIALINQNFCDIFGIPVPPSALVGADCSEAAEQSKVLFKDPNGFISRVNSLLAAKELVISDLLEMKDGRFLERDYIPVFEGNNYQGHLWKYTDVTKRVLAETAISNSEIKYRSLIQNMNLGLLEVDLNEVVLFSNLSMQQMTGYEAEELLGKNATILLAPDGLEIMEAQKRKRIHGLPDVYEVPILKKDGTRRWLLISGAPVYDQNQKIIGSIGIHLDITQRKEMEEELKSSRIKAEESSAAKELFMASMSHEIRTPMNAIIGMQSLLSKTALVEKQRRYVDAIGNSARNLLALINDILDFTKIGAGAVQLLSENLDLREMVRQVKNLLEYKTDEKGLEFRTRIDPKIADLHTGDQLRIYQVLVNLVGNAIKFTETGFVGIFLNLESDGEESQKITFSVTDTGPGIDPKDIDNIFKVFTQANNQIHKHFGGTGLGLTISQQLIELMGGQISVQSIVGEGSAFSFSLNLPISKQTWVNPAENRSSKARLDGKLILVVEDNDYNRLLAQTLLETYGASVAVADNGRQALAKVSEQNPDLILMDLQMPVLDGLAATAILRATGFKNPIIALTANAYSADAERCRKGGMNDILQKPYDEYHLIETISRCIGNTEADNNKEMEELTQIYSLEKVKALGADNPLFIGKMLRLAVEQLDKTAIEIELAVKANNRQTVKMLAHRMKPTLDHLQANELRFLIRELENCMESGIDDNKLATTVNRYHQVSDILVEALNKEILNIN